MPFQTDNGRGFGLRLLEDVKKDEYLLEYVGEIINETEFARRMAKYGL